MGLTTCHLCKEHSGTVTTENQGIRSKWTCPRCGTYYLTGTLLAELELNTNHVPYLSRVRIATRRAKEPLTLDTYNTKTTAESVFIPSLIQDRLNLILRILYEMSKPLGKAVPVAMNDYPKFYCESAEEFTYLLKYLSTEQCVWPESNAYRLEVRGLDRVEKAIGGVGSGKKVFVAMSFDPEDRHLFDDVFEPVCREAGYEAYRVDGLHELGKIDDAIQAGLRTSAFVIADFTKNKHGVYYESGFGHALGRPVILTCPKAMLKAHDIHFDVNHYPFLDYETTDELKAKLLARILGSVGPYKPR